MAKTIRYRLALDLGSTSLGWAVFRLNEQNQPTAIIRAGVRIFSDGRNPKDGSSLAVTRRAARAMRRRRDRLLRRKERMLRKLIEHGFFPGDSTERKALERLNPYELRARGLHQALTPAEFARALFHLNQRRGFQSNRKTDRKDNESGVLKKAIDAMRTALQEDDCSTVGEWLWKMRMQQRPHGVAGQGVRARYRETPYTSEDGRNRIEKSYDLYIDRAMVAEEFDALWTAQARFNPSIFHEHARKQLRDTLLYQRPLLPVKPGRCTLMSDQERAALALPSTQRFRIYQEVNNLRLLDDEFREQALELDQRNQLLALLESRTKVSFNAMRKALGTAASFNLEDDKRDGLKGNATTVTLSKKELFGKAWADFSPSLQDEVVEQLLNQESEQELVDWLQHHTGVNEAQAERIANASLPEGYGRLSREALARILPQLEQAVISYAQAVQEAGFDHHSDLGFDFDVQPDELIQLGDRVIASTGEVKPVLALKQLPYYGRALQRHVGFGSGKPEDSPEKRYGRIANPTVHIGLNQVRLVVNTLMRRYGRPEEVVVELARELKQSREQKLETQRQQALHQKRNERMRKSAAETLGISPDRVKTADVQKWILWEELSRDVIDRRCPYSGVQISATMLLSEQVETEHILPFSRTLDDSLNNRTVAMRQANRIKGNRTPWEARQDFAAQNWDYEDILERAEQMPLRKRYRFAPDGYERWLGEDKDFLARALNDTRYLSRVAAEYLRLVCPGSATRVIPGQMTAMLRARFGLNDVLGLAGEKNRNDHRHHAVDACVVGVTDQGLMQRFARASASTREAGLNRLVEDMPLPWPSYRDHVQRAVRHIWVSHRPDHGYQGGFVEDTAYRPPHVDAKGQWRTRGIAGNKPNERAADSKAMVAIQGAHSRYAADGKGRRVFKGYVGGSNYGIEITANDKGRWEGQVISTFEAYRIVRESGEQRLRDPHRAQNGRRLVMRLMINDCLRLQTEDGESVMRVVNINSNNGQIFMAPVHEANVDSRNRDKQDAFTYLSKYAGSLQKACARPVSISPIGELRDPGFRE